MYWIDSHAHLCDGAFTEDRDLVLEGATAASISDIVNVCTGPDTLKMGRELARKHQRIHLAASTTPHDAADPDPFFSQVEEAAKAGELVAIGETGLEYFHPCSPRPIQQRLLERYLELAHRMHLPLIVHCREAFTDLFSILDAGPPVQGVLHCFTGTLEEAKSVIARDWYLSFSGIVTFKRSIDLREVVKWIPLEKMLIETDCPYLAPQAYRGKRNEPKFLLETARIIASERAISEQVLAEHTSENACSLFRLRR